MDNKELIRRFVSFDEDDVSTGFNSVSGNQQPFEEYLSDNIRQLYYVRGSGGTEPTPGYEEYLRDNLMPKYSERTNTLYLTKFPYWSYKGEEWQTESGFPFYRLSGAGKNVICAWDADFLVEIVRKYKVVLDCEDWKIGLWFHGTPENIGFVIKNARFMRPYSGWTTSTNDLGEMVYDKWHGHPEVTVWTTGQPQSGLYPKGISYGELLAKVPKLWVIKGTQSSDMEELLVYPNSKDETLLKELKETCDVTANE